MKVSTYRNSLLVYVVTITHQRKSGEGYGSIVPPPFGHFHRYYLLQRLKMAPPLCSRNIRYLPPFSQVDLRHCHNDTSTTLFHLIFPLIKVIDFFCPPYPGIKFCTHEYTSHQKCFNSSVFTWQQYAQKCIIRRRWLPH